MRNFLLLSFFFISLSADSYEFSAMTLNTQNLFDTVDDPKKNDKAYLPIELKKSQKHISSCQDIKVKSWKDECLFLDWDEDTKNTKLMNLANEIIKYNNSGPDILALQEVENINILTQLFKLLEPYGYKNLSLLEGKDYRGIDTALITKFNIVDSKLHYITFTGKYENKDTRPILEVTLDVNNKKLKIYNVHFPAGYHDVSMRIDSLNFLKDLLNSHKHPSIALGDFNINIKEDRKLDIYKSQETYWSVAHLNGCNKCKGTYYYAYEKNWSFLDSIFLSKDRNIKYIPDSIDIHITKTNSYSETGRPIKFNPINKSGVSDHLPMVANFILN
ncbi:MAG: hypothetical protein CMQ83_05520 [Gammaproteobacteria bacterium]|nr:hypothetical protein [Gammaproteobacteria bacterium]